MEEEKKTKSTVGVVIAIILITVVAIVAVNLFKGKKKPAFPMSGGMGRNVSSVTSVISINPITGIILSTTLILLSSVKYIIFTFASALASTLL